MSHGEGPENPPPPPPAPKGGETVPAAHLTEPQPADPAAPPPAGSGTRKTRREGNTKKGTRKETATRKSVTDAASQTLAGFVSATRRFLKKFTGAPPEVKIALPRDGDMRLFALAGEIDDRLAMQAATWLLLVQAMKSDADVVITVDSPGGSVTAGLSLIDIMLKSTCRVRTHCARQALGIASIVLAAGTKGYRTLSRSALLSLPGSAMAGDGQTTQFASPRVISAVAAATGRPTAQVEKEILRLKALSPKLAVNHGLADAVGVPGR